MIRGKIAELRDGSVVKVTELRKNIHFFYDGDLSLEWEQRQGSYCVTVKEKSNISLFINDVQMPPMQMLVVAMGSKIRVEQYGKTSWLALMARDERYLINGIIAENSTKTKFTCKALDVVLRSRVIMKLQRSQSATIDQLRIEKFRRSAKEHSRLVSPYVPQLRDVGEKEENGIVYEYQVYDYFAGETLASWKKKNPFHGEDAHSRAVKLFHQVALALGDLHKLGIAHRNLNETHILIDHSERVHLVGMSLLKSDDTQLTLSGQIIGDIRLFPTDIDNYFHQDIYALIVLFLYTVSDLDLNNLRFPIVLKETLHAHLPSTLVSLLQAVIDRDFPHIEQVISAFAQAAKFAPHDINRRQQYLVVPQVDVLDVPVSVETWYEPLEEVGGDFYDIVSDEKNKLGLLIGDAMGHGIKAAFFCHMIQPVAQTLAAHHIVSPAKVLRQMNALLYRSKGPMRFSAFATAMYAELTLTDTNKYLVYANAGHPHPILCRDGKACLATSDSNMFCGNKLGLCDRKNFRMFENCVELRSQDFIVLYTDGIIEAKNSSNEQYTQQRLLQLLTTSFGNAEQVVDAIRTDVADFSGGKYDDDITLLVAEIH